MFVQLSGSWRIPLCPAIWNVPDQGASALHVDKLQRQVVILLPEQPHDFLEVIDLLAGDPDLFVLNSCLDLHLETLDEFDDFLAGILGDTLLDTDIHGRCDIGGRFDLFKVQTLGVQLQPGALTKEHLRNFFSLPIVSGDNMDILGSPV